MSITLRVSLGRISGTIVSEMPNLAINSSSDGYAFARSNEATMNEHFIRYKAIIGLHNFTKKSYIFTHLYRIIDLILLIEELRKARKQTKMGKISYNSIKQIINNWIVTINYD